MLPESSDFLKPMKKIFLLSDNHGFYDDAILHHASQADEIWHAGDWLNNELFLKLEELGKPLRCVWGNADGAELRKCMPEDLYFEVEGFRVYITHIGGYPGKYNVRALKNIQAFEPSIFVCGHSHILRVMRDPARNNMLCINPGACGLQGFHQVRTALRFELNNGQAAAMAVIEFGKRS